MMSYDLVTTYGPIWGTVGYLIILGVGASASIFVLTKK